MASHRAHIEPFAVQRAPKQIAVRGMNDGMREPGGVLPNAITTVAEASNATSLMLIALPRSVETHGRKSASHPSHTFHGLGLDVLLIHNERFSKHSPFVQCVSSTRS